MRPAADPQPQTPATGFANPHQPTREGFLLREPKEVEQAERADDVHLAVQGRYLLLGRFDEVCGEEGGGEGVPVAEEVVAEADEGGGDVQAVQVRGGRGEVDDELAGILPEATAGVEEGLVVAEAREGFGVVGVFGEVELEEA